MWISIEVYSEAQGGEQPHLSWTQQEKFWGASEFAWSKEGSDRMMLFRL